jgi:hypothetical protein
MFAESVDRIGKIFLCHLRQQGIADQVNIIIGPPLELWRHGVSG